MSFSLPSKCLLFLDFSDRIGTGITANVGDYLTRLCKSQESVIVPGNEIALVNAPKADETAAAASDTLYALLRCKTVFPYLNFGNCLCLLLILEVWVSAYRFEVRERIITMYTEINSKATLSQRHSAVTFQNEPPMPLCSPIQRNGLRAKSVPSRMHKEFCVVERKQVGAPTVHSSVMKNQFCLFVICVCVIPYMCHMDTMNIDLHFPLRPAFGTVSCHSCHSRGI